MEKKQKPCARCGAIFTYERERKTLCDACSRLRQTELARLRRQQQRLEMAPRKCPICGGPILEKRRRYCVHCSNLGMAERREKEKKQRQGRKSGPLGLNLQQIVALTKRYRPPYCTYGKLRSYIDTTGHLPPEEYRKEE